MEVNLNKSSVKDLQKIIHIGAKRATKIVESRPLKDLYELSKVYGLGKKRMDDIIKQDEIVITV